MSNERSGGDPNRDYSAPVSSPLDAYKKTNLFGSDEFPYEYKNKNANGLWRYQFDYGIYSDNNRFRKGRSQSYASPGQPLPGGDYNALGQVVTDGGYSAPNFNSDTLYFNTNTPGLNKYNRLDESMLEMAYGTQTVDSFRGGLAKAMHFAYNTPGVVFKYGREDGGILYDLREKHRGYYEDVEDGFTPERTNFNQATVTLAELAAQVKTLKRDLKRAGIL